MKKSFFDSLHFLLFFKKKKKNPFYIYCQPQPFSFFPPLFSSASVWEGSNSWVRTAAPSAVRWRTSQGQRERLRSVHGCVPCSITALTDMGKEGSRREEEVGGIKWFNLGRALKSFRERVVKNVNVQLIARVEVSLNEGKRLVVGNTDSKAACSSPWPFPLAAAALFWFPTWTLHHLISRTINLYQGETRSTSPQRCLEENYDHCAEDTELNTSGKQIYSRAILKCIFKGGNTVLFTPILKSLTAAKWRF